MKKILALLAAISTFACATGSQGDGQRVMPEVEVGEVVGIQQVQMTGPFDVRYAVQISNPAQQPITLKRIEVRQIGTGSYQLRGNMPVLVKETIQPGASTQVAFWLHAYAYVLPGMTASSEPVTVRVITYYDSPTGSFQRITNAIIGQF